MSRRTLFLIVATVILCALIIAGACTTNTSTATPSREGIKKFGSANEIREYIKNNTAAAEEAYGYSGSWAGIDSVGTLVPTAAPQTGAAESSVAKGITVPSAANILSIGSADHSTTNVQVAGVDEPDFVKNDGKYIYVISGQTLAIVDAYPAASATIISKTEIGGSPRDLFIKGDRLVLLVTGSEDTGMSLSGGAESASSAVPSAKVAATTYYPIHNALPVTHAVFYDISNRGHPGVLKDYTIDGDYIDARMIGSNLYLVTREQVYPFDTVTFTVPAVHEGAKTVVTPDVYYFDNPEYQYAFTMVSSFDTQSAAGKDAKTFLVGSGNLLYVSENAMYFTCQQYHNVYSPSRPIPMLATDDVAANGVAASAPGVSAPVLPEVFNTMSEADKEAYIQKMKNTGQQAIANRQIDQTTTAIHKIAISNSAITYVARGDVPGSLHDQFAMDEYNGNLRLATTSNVYTLQGSYEYNSVFVLDASMKTIGSLSHIAEQEQIYSTRFIGDRLYMVTYKRVDPFFVIDLSAPSNPKILGRLKIPGFSDYLHPYDVTHIIGVGKETATNEWGGVSTAGIKLALFDVSNVSNPKQIDHVQIGDAGSDSAALSDHRAFLFNKGRNLLVIPARVVNNQVSITNKSGVTRPNIWYGAYVFGITPETGFTLRGTIEHGTGSDSSYYYGISQNEVKRSLYIGDVLYTLSSKKILANSLTNINTTLATINLPGTGDVLYPPMMAE